MRGQPGSPRALLRGQGFTPVHSVRVLLGLPVTHMVGQPLTASEGLKNWNPARKAMKYDLKLILLNSIGIYQICEYE